MLYNSNATALEVMSQKNDQGEVKITYKSRLHMDLEGEALKLNDN